MTNTAGRKARQRDAIREMKRFGAMKSEGPAPSEGDVAVAAAADEDPAPPRERRILPVKSRRRRPAAAAASADMSVANQGLPGSGNTGMDLAAGQRLQEDADAWKQLPEVQQLLRHHREELDGVYETLTVKEKELTELQEQTEVNKRDFANIKALRDYNTKVTKDRDDLSKKHREIEDARQSGTDEHYNLEVLKQEVARLTSELSDTVHAKHKVEAEKDALEGINEELNQTIDELEDQAEHSRQVLIENAGLKVEIMGVHRDLEDAFSDMAEDLTFKEKFTFINEHQQKAAETLAAATAAANAGRSRIASGASLHDELEDASDAGSEAAPKEELSFSDITSVETVPVAAPVATKKPLELSTITAVDTAPVVATPAPKKPFTFSTISAVDTSPVAPPAVAAPKKAEETLGFSDVTAVDTAPVAATPAPKKPLTFSTTSAVDTSPVAPPVVAAPKKAEETLGFSDVTTVETYPIAAPKVKPQIKWRTKNIYGDVDRPVPVTPWWMWVLFLIAVMTCAGVSAALVREKNIWTDANEMASLRLMGLQQESWIEWIGLGVGDLLTSVGGAGAGLELFR